MLFTIDQPTTRRLQPSITDCEEQKAGVRWNVGDVGYPELVWKRRGEVALDEIVGRNCFSIAKSRRDSLAPRSTVAVTFAHQSCNALITR